MTDNRYLGVQGLEELITLTKNNLTKKADALQFDVMPDPVKYTGKVIQYIGVSDASYTRSHFYYSDGTRWNDETISDEQATKIKIVNALPAWINANPNILYILKGTTDNTMSLYVKNASVNGAWFTVESGGSFAIVDSLPQWSDANASTIYFKANGDALAGYIKNTEASNAWYTLGGDMNYMRGLHDPDWSGARNSFGIVSAASGYHSIFTCPARGNLTICVLGDDLSFVKINSIYSMNLLPNIDSHSPKFIITPVNKGDVFGITNDNSTDINYYCMFVPYKVQ